ncbi:MAG: hypothetical protein JNM18_07080 [Planctomycetaceae bacterium]|nr:hypothetical protein [Planctomycetaceae bacterium]
MSAYQAVLDYQTGDVHLRYSGLPGTEFFNIDPVYRCENVTYGCVVSGNEWVYQDPYNAAARFLITQFGFAKGSYLGPYPTEADVHSALADADFIDPLVFAQDKVQLSSRTVPLDKAVGLRLMRACGYDLGRDGRIEGGRLKPKFIKAKRWNTGCVIIQIQNEWLVDKPHAMIAVIDAQTGRPFAYYPVGEYYHRFPPVFWKERNRD